MAWAPAVPTPARDCGGYACNVSGCNTGCTSAAQCNAGYTCSTGACVPLPGLVLHWRLDENSGPLALDSSGGGRAGSFVGDNGSPVTSALVPPVSFTDPASRSFSRSSRHAIRLANMPQAIKPRDTLTLSVWYRATSLDLGSSGVQGAELISAGDSYILRVRDDGAEFTVFDQIHEKCVMTAPGRLDGNWHHIAGVLSDNGSEGLFRRGRALLGQRQLNAVYTRGPDFWVGRHGNTGVLYDFDGNVDDVRVYDRSLSAAEIARLAAGKSQQ